MGGRFPAGHWTAPILLVFVLFLVSRFVQD